MSDRTKGMHGAELAEYYDSTHDVSEFDESAAYPAEVRRNVTISVRFSGEEIATLRERAEAAGVKVTAYIRAAALQQAAPLDRLRLIEALGGGFGRRRSCGANPALIAVTTAALAAQSELHARECGLNTDTPSRKSQDPG